MGIRYGSRAGSGAAGALCCDNRGFAGGDTHSIMNNPQPTAARKHMRPHVCTHCPARSLAQYRHTDIGTRSCSQAHAHTKFTHALT